MLNLKIELPCIISVRDYHDFNQYLQVLKEFGIKGVKYKEVGCVGAYLGIFYVEKDKKYNKLLAEAKAEVDEFEKEIWE